MLKVDGGKGTVVCDQCSTIIDSGLSIQEYDFMYEGKDLCVDCAQPVKSAEQLIAEFKVLQDSYEAKIVSIFEDRKKCKLLLLEFLGITALQAGDRSAPLTEIMDAVHTPTMKYRDRCYETIKRLADLHVSVDKYFDEYTSDIANKDPKSSSDETEEIE